MKKGYHSRQSKFFGSIPRSEYLGVAAGFAIGMIVQGLTAMSGSAFEIAGAVIGFAIGYYIDAKYYAEKDVPLEQMKQEANE